MFKQSPYFSPTFWGKSQTPALRLRWNLPRYMLAMCQGPSIPYMWGWSSHISRYLNPLPGPSIPKNHQFLLHSDNFHWNLRGPPQCQEIRSYLFLRVGMARGGPLRFPWNFAPGSCNISVMKSMTSSRFAIRANHFCMSLSRFSHLMNHNAIMEPWTTMFEWMFDGETTIFHLKIYIVHHPNW